MIGQIRDAVLAMGVREKRAVPVEHDALRYARRSIVSRTTIKKGTRIAEDDLCLKRPGTGLSPKFFEMVVGRTAAVDIPEDTVLTWDLIQ